MGYFIEEVKCGVTPGGFACGPCPGCVLACVKFNDGTSSKYLYNSEFEGYPAFFLSDEDVFDRIMEDETSEDTEKFYEENAITNFDGIQLSDDYNEVFSSLYNSENKEAVALIKYIIYLTRCPNNETEDVINQGKGHDVMDINLPMSDVEEDYFEDNK